MKPTEQELKDIADAINALPDTPIQTAGWATNNWAGLGLRKDVKFDALRYTKYRIVPTKQTRSMNQNEWNQYAVEVGRVKLRGSDITEVIGQINSEEVQIGKLFYAHSTVASHYERLDGSPLTVEE